MVKGLFRRRDTVSETARALYDRAVAQAREPAFYRDLGVPDTLDGRFDLIVLHVVLLVRRLRRASTPGPDLAQSIFDTLVSDMDRSLREMGAGDLGVPPKVKRMAQAYYGRQQAYDAALDACDTQALSAALARNLYGTASPPPDAVRAVVTAYVEEQEARLATLADADLTSVAVPAFAPPPDTASVV